MHTRRYGQYHFLSEEEMTKIHSATLKILEETGVSVPDERLLKLAESKGALVNRGAGTMRFPKNMVEKCLDENRAMHAAATKDTPLLRDDQRKVHYSFGGQSVRAIDLDTNEVRNAGIKDMADASRIASALDEVKADGGLYHSTETPPLTDDLYSYHTMVGHGTKPVGAGIMHLSSIPWLEEMAVVVHGSKQAVRDKGVMRFNAFVASPLQYPKDAIEKMWAVHDRGYKVSLGWTMTVVGGSGPVTLAGSTVVCNADALSGLILTRMINSDALAGLGAAPVTMDMRSGVGLYADPRRLLICGAFMDISRFYGFPCGGFHIGIDAAYPGIQAAAERMFTSMIALAYWDGHVNLRLGIMGPSNTVASMAQIFIDLEIGRMIEKWLQGIEVNEETMSLADIMDAGIGGNFLSREHTARHFRTESWLPELFEHHIPVAGPLPNSDPIYEKARLKAKQTIAAARTNPLPPDKQKELDRLLEQAIKSVN